MLPATMTARRRSPRRHVVTAASTKNASMNTVLSWLMRFHGFSIPTAVETVSPKSRTGLRSVIAV